MNSTGRFYAAGRAAGEVLVLAEPLSFYGGIDVQTGTIIDHSHPNRGECVAGRILVMPGGRGSSSSSSVLAEAIRLKTGPLGIILGRPDPIITVACLVAQSLYAMFCPLVVCSIEGMRTGDAAVIAPGDDGAARIHITSARSHPQTNQMAE